jgi:hypothetical protein
MTAEEALQYIEQEGIVLESARGQKSSLAQRITGRPIKGSWWADPDAGQVFALTRAVRSSPDVLVCRLVQGKITFIHRRLWPALVRVADRLPLKRLAAVEDLHTDTGKHVTRETAFPDWVPRDVLEAAEGLDDEAALTLLGEWIQLDGDDPR